MLVWELIGRMRADGMKLVEGLVLVLSKAEERLKELWSVLVSPQLSRVSFRKCRSLHNFSSCGSVKLTSSVYDDDSWIQHHNLKMHFYTFTQNTVDF